MGLIDSSISVWHVEHVCNVPGLFVPFHPVVDCWDITGFPRTGKKWRLLTQYIGRPVDELVNKFCA